MQGKSVRVAPKVRYNHPILSIDAVRSNPHEYLIYEDYVTRGMMTLENDAFEDRSDDIIIFDRTVTDSLFYALFYLDKSDLSLTEMVVYNNLIVDAIKHSTFAFDNIYDHVIFLPPLSRDWAGDPLRPKSIGVTKYIEGAVIDMLNKSFAKEGRYHYRDANDMNNLPAIITEITKLIELNEILKNTKR